MADVRESFTTLEGASAEGLALRAIQEGQPTASKNGSLALAFKDSSGNAIAPQLNAAGKLPVTLDAVNADGKSARGSIAGNAAMTTVASLTLAVDKIYDNLDFIVSCFRDTVFQVILSDDGAETILAEAQAGAGQYSFHAALKELEISAGSSGVQLLLIKGQNLNALSDMRASLSVRLTN